MEPPHIFKLGDECTLVDARGNRKPAEVILASPNGKALAVKFDGFFSPHGSIGGFLEMMPLCWTGECFESFDQFGSREASGVVKVEPMS